MVVDRTLSISLVSSLIEFFDTLPCHAYCDIAIQYLFPKQWVPSFFIGWAVQLWLLSAWFSYSCECSSTLLTLLRPFPLSMLIFNILLDSVPSPPYYFACVSGKFHFTQTARLFRFQHSQKSLHAYPHAARWLYCHCKLPIIRSMTVFLIKRITRSPF